MPNGKFGIAPQFILGSIENGRIIENPKYNPEYDNKNGEYIDDQVSFNTTNRSAECQTFNEAFQNSKLGFFQKLLKKLGLKKEVSSFTLIEEITSNIGFTDRSYYCQKLSENVKPNDNRSKKKNHPNEHTRNSGGFDR